MNRSFLKELPIVISFFLVTIIVGYDIAHTHKPDLEIEAKVTITSEPTKHEIKATPTVTLTLTPTPTIAPKKAIETSNSPVVDYIQQKFGENADKALLLLKGNSKCKGENPTLNPRAVLVNKGTHAGSRDRGIFQINDKFHPLTDDQAFDYKQNIDYAYRMYKNDNYSFRRWTAGRCLGI
jgi:hypothetical protein